jgi:hypothetical protein
VRELAQLELEMVAGGGLWEDFKTFFSLDWGPSAIGSGSMQSVSIVGQKMSDIDKFAYDIQQIRNALPDCQVTFTISGAITAGTVSATGSLTPSGTVSGTVTTSKPTTTYTCPAVSKGGIPLQPSY